MFWLLKDDLRLYLKNKYRADEITDNEVEAIIFKLVSSSHEPLYEANKALFTEMVEGFFFRREDKTKQDLFVRLIDFDDVVNNIFKIVNQFEVKGVQETRIPDSVVFINGLPLVVLEFKSAIKENTTIYNAYQQVTVRYTRDIPDLFKYNAFVIISDGVNNKYGSLFADYDYFYSWNKIGDEETLAEGINSLYVKYQRPIGNDVFRARWENDGECGLSVWYDAFECREGTKSLAHYTAGEFAPYSVITERKVGKGRVILVGSVLSHDDILRLVDIPPILEASENVTLTRRTGKESGMIAVETAGTSGRLFLDGEYRDLLTGRTLCGNIELAPYEVLVLRK